MDNQATYDDVNLILKLYELRRDDRLREARRFFGGLKVKSLAELRDACPPGSEQDASVRMVTSYWEMAASFITSGVLNQELFQQSGGELLFVWTKIQDVVPELRKAFNSPKYLASMARFGLFSSLSEKASTKTSGCRDLIKNKLYACT